jgi:hypothetical protein
MGGKSTGLLREFEKFRSEREIRERENLREMRGEKIE